jgi:hypothetical protein
MSVVDILGTFVHRYGTIHLLQGLSMSRLQEAVNPMGITHLATMPKIAALLCPERCPTLETLAVDREAMTAAVQRVWSPTVATVNVVYCA